MPKPETKGKIVSFKAAREAVSGAAMPPQHAEKQPPASPSKTGGYAEVWLKAHTDKDALIKENLALKKQQQVLESAYRTVMPTIPEHLLFYGTLLVQVLGLVVWVGIAISKVMS